MDILLGFILGSCMALAGYWLGRLHTYWMLKDESPESISGHLSKRLRQRYDMELDHETYDKICNNLRQRREVGKERESCNEYMDKETHSNSWQEVVSINEKKINVAYREFYQIRTFLPLNTDEPLPEDNPFVRYFEGRQG